MTKNLNSSIITMSREDYDMLIYLAEAGVRDLGEQRYLDVIKRIRKKNKQLAEEHQTLRYMEREEFNTNKLNVKYLLRYTGKIVYLEINGNLYAPIRILSRSLEKYPGSECYLRYRHLSQYRRDGVHMAHYGNIVTELPDIYTPIEDGEFEGCFIFPNDYKEINQKQWRKNNGQSA